MTTIRAGEPRTLLLASLLLTASAAQAAPDEITLSASPQQLLLGRDKRAVLEVVTSPDHSDLRLEPNTGRIEEIKQVGPGRFRAVYLPPRPRYPQTAIIAAVARSPRGHVHGWTVIPLIGSGKAVVETKPRAKVTVRIGTQSFGPIQADNRGFARVPVVVPPGIRVGYDGAKPIDLGLPSTSHVHVAISRQAVRADLEHDLELRVYTVTPEGAPRPEPEIELSVSRGRVSAPSTVSPGVSRATWRLDAGMVGTASVVAQLTGEAKSRSEMAIGLVPGTPAIIELTVSPETVIAGTHDNVTIEARVSDGAGNPTPGAVQLHCGFGTSSAVEAVDESTSRGGCNLPANFAGEDRFEIGAELAATPDVATSTVVALQPGPTTVLEVAPERIHLWGDESAELEVVARDAYGNATSGLLHAAAEAGVAGEPLSVGPGEYRVRYTAPSFSTERQLKVDLTLDDARGQSTVELGPSGQLCAAPKIGLVTSFVGLTSFRVAGEVGGWTELFGEQLGARLELGYFGSSSRTPVDISAAAGTDAQYDATYLSLTPSIAWRRNLGPKLRLWVDAGVAATHIWSAVQVTGQPEVTERSWVARPHVGVAVGWRVWRGWPFAEARLLWQAGPSMQTTEGAFAGLIFSLGYRFAVL